MAHPFFKIHLLDWRTGRNLKPITEKTEKKTQKNLKKLRTNHEKIRKTQKKLHRGFSLSSFSVEAMTFSFILLAKNQIVVQIFRSSLKNNIKNSLQKP
jgi:hypothetical protein